VGAQNASVARETSPSVIGRTEKGGLPETKYKRTIEIAVCGEPPRAQKGFCSGMAGEILQAGGVCRERRHQQKRYKRN